LLFPFLLFRFTTAFGPPGPRTAAALRALTTAMVVWTFAQPSIPGADDDWTPLFGAYLAGFLVHWTVLSVFSAWRLWHAGSGQPSVARRRMRLLAVASGAITLALFLVAGSSNGGEPLTAGAPALA